MKRNKMILQIKVKYYFTSNHYLEICYSTSCNDYDAKWGWGNEVESNIQL